MKRPADVYVPSGRPLPSQLPSLDYPGHDDAVLVNRTGRIRIGNQVCYVTAALAGEYVGIREELDGSWLVTFASVDLGHFNGDHLIPDVMQRNPNN